MGAFSNFVNKKRPGESQTEGITMKRCKYLGLLIIALVVWNAVSWNGFSWNNVD